MSTNLPRKPKVVRKYRRELLPAKAKFSKPSCERLHINWSVILPHMSWKPSKSAMEIDNPEALL